MRIVCIAVCRQMAVARQQQCSLLAVSLTTAVIICITAYCKHKLCDMLCWPRACSSCASLAPGSLATGLWVAEARCQSRRSTHHPRQAAAGPAHHPRQAAAGPAHHATCVITIAYEAASCGAPMHNDLDKCFQQGIGQARSAYSSTPARGMEASDMVCSTI
jgi:hypothetical protein